jgi:pilus assembly protein CpaE
LKRRGASFLWHRCGHDDRDDVAERSAMSEVALRDRSPTPMRRAKRSVVGFVADAASKAVLQDALHDLVQVELTRRRIEVSHEIKCGTLKSAIAAMMRAPGPDILIIDIGAGAAPGRLLAALSEVIEPSVQTLLLDADPFIGISRGLCGGAPREALGALLIGESAIDAATLDVAIEPVQGRLSLLALPPDLDRQFVPKDGAATALVAALRQQFNFIIVDLPFLPLQSHRELLEAVHHRVIVLDPSIAGLRDTLRLLALPKGPTQPQRPTIMLNNVNIKGGFDRRRLEDALKRKVDIAMPDLPKRFQAVGKLADLMLSPRDTAFRAIAELAREAGFESGRGALRVDSLAISAA